MPTRLATGSRAVTVVIRVPQAQFRRIATPSITTFLPLELILIVSVPLRAAANVVTAISLLLTVVVDVRLIVRMRTLRVSLALRPSNDPGVMSRPSGSNPQAARGSSPTSQAGAATGPSASASRVWEAWSLSRSNRNALRDPAGTTGFVRPHGPRSVCSAAPCC